ncbi:MAG: tetratricopeptide repeat protein [Saprospiraceae bacterium]|nr:tetratricopeptide repeat protein [Saprospiraceae bacterium]
MNFNKDVLERSHQVPVVVDFWAPWCGPCRVLGPTIEQLAEEGNGKWELIKLNTEEYQEIALEYSIRSIPNVKMFYDGEVIAEFAGALPRPQILQWLDENLPTADKAEWSGLQKQLLAASDPEAIELLSGFLELYPEHREAQLNLARKLVFTDPGKAMELVEQIKMGDQDYEAVEDIRVVGELNSITDSNHGGLSSELLKASGELKTGDYEQAVQRIIDVVGKDKSIHDELPRRAAIAVFRLLGTQHPVTKKYRRIFDMVLY